MAQRITADGGPSGRMPPMKSSAADRAAKTLRREIMALPEGAHLGLEGALAARLGVSRPTFRQTARMLVQEQLLVVRRGVGGGYYTSRPRADAVGQLASTFMALSHAEPLDLLCTLHALYRGAVPAAVENDNAQLRAELAEAIQRLRESIGKPIRDGLIAGSQMNAVVRRMASNPVAELFAQVVYRFGSTESMLKVFRGREDRLTLVRDQLIMLGEAILARDVALALDVSGQSASLVEQWTRAAAA